MSIPAPYIAPHGNGVVHWIAGHWDGAYLDGNWNALCGRIVPGFTVPAVLVADEPICRRCAARAARIGLNA
jgi:hypothetical protein